MHQRCVQATPRLQPHRLSGASSSLPRWFPYILPWEPDTDQLPTRPQTGCLIKACDRHDISWYLWAAAPPSSTPPTHTQPSGGSALHDHRPASALERGMNQGSWAWRRGPSSAWGPPDTSRDQKLTQLGGEEGVTGRATSCTPSTPLPPQESLRHPSAHPSQPSSAPPPSSFPGWTPPGRPSPGEPCAQPRASRETGIQVELKSPNLLRQVSRHTGNLT